LYYYIRVYFHLNVKFIFKSALSSLKNCLNVSRAHRGRDIGLSFQLAIIATRLWPHCLR